MSDAPAAGPKALHKNEELKAQSNYLRGHILRDLEDTSSATITEESGQLTKFHGIYPQDNRDLRAQRRKEGKEKAYIFMARIRVPVAIVMARLSLDRGSAEARLDAAGGQVSEALKT